MSVLSVGAVSAGEWERSFTGSLTTQQGNTHLTSYTVAMSSEYAGDLSIEPFGQLGRINLPDSEVRFTVSHTRGQLNDALYEHDGSASFLLEIMAHETFSPFFLSYWAYDSTTFLERRVQLGAGGKYTAGKEISVSVAYLWEIEDYKAEAVRRQYRLSVRPKYKKKFDSGITVNYMIFIQPLVRNPAHLLIDNQFTLSIPTPSEKFMITATWRDQYNSQPPKNVKERDTDVKVGFTLSW